MCTLQQLHYFARDRHLISLIDDNSSESFHVYVTNSSVALLLGSQMPRERHFESFLKLLLSFKRPHLSSLLISPASE